MKILVFGTPGFIETDGKSTANILSEVGENFGNLIFQRATTDFFKTSVTGHTGQSFIKYNDVKFTDWDVLVWPAANHLRSGPHLKPITQFLEMSNLPLVIFGLGTQSATENIQKQVSALNEDPDIKPFVEAIKRKAVFIGVRGEFTHKVMADLGLESEVLGCPSLFLNLSKKLGNKVQSCRDYLGSLNLDELLDRSVFNMEQPFQLSGRQQHLHRQIINEGIGTKLWIYQQSGGEASVNIFGRKFNDVSLGAAWSIYLKITNGQCSFNEFMHFIQNNSWVPKSYDEWLNHLKPKNFVFGPTWCDGRVGG